MCEQRAIMSTRWGLGKHDLRPEDDDDGGFTLPCPPLGDARQDDDSEEEAAAGARPRGWNAVNTREHCDDWDDDDELSTPPQAASRVALDASRSQRRRARRGTEVERRHGDTFGSCRRAVLTICILAPSLAATAIAAMAVAGVTHERISWFASGPSRLAEWAPPPAYPEAEAYPALARAHTSPAPPTSQHTPPPPPSPSPPPPVSRPPPIAISLQQPSASPSFHVSPHLPPPRPEPLRPSTPPPSTPPPPSPKPPNMPPRPPPPPSPRPPPPFPPLGSIAPATASRLNARFRRSPYGDGDGWGAAGPQASPWPATGLLADVGVLIHVFDGFEAHSGIKWLPADGGSGSMSASLIYAQQRANPSRTIPTFNRGARGLVLRPMHHLVQCGCESDCGGRCVGAYGMGGAGPAPQRATTPLWCDPVTTEAGEWHGGCVWQPGPSLAKMFYLNQRSAGYNEIVVSAAFWREHMPSAVEAVIGDEGVHRAFLQAYGLSKRDVPLLTFDPANFDSPFSD